MATTKKSTADQVKAAMAKVEAAKAAEAAKADTKKAAETKAAAKAAEKKAPAKTTATKAAEKKAPVKKAAPEKKAAVKKTETVYIQCCGYEVTTADITAKVVAAVGKKTVKELNIYVKPEDGKVYYTADGEQGRVDL
ncbi:MAG: DUF6465 family protein [Clostridium sp.]|nr:DUF6465 family protein [Clostridium sp.]